jgi:DDE superfamily endonuclease
MEIIALLSCLEQSMSKTTLRQLGVIVTAVLAMSGKVTQLGIARWAEPGGSYRSVQRFFHTPLVWLQIHWALVSTHLLTDGDTWLLAGDETVTSKAGKATYGRDRFFSSVHKQMIAGVSFFALALISVEQRRSSVLRVEQLSKDQTTTQPKRRPTKSKSRKGKTGASKPPAGGVRAGAGRPKGRKTMNRREVELPAYLQHIQTLLQEVLSVIGTRLVPAYLLLDGAFGHNKAVQMVRRCGLHLISRLHHNAALFFPYTGEQKKFGTRRKYGDQLDPKHIPADYRQSSQVEGGVCTDTYQMTLWSKSFPDPLNIVVLVATHLASGRQAHVILFCSDLTLPAEQLTHYYRLRFQIEFNFREAKQCWGLADFMSIRQQSVANAANLAFFMVNLAQVLLAQFSAIPDVGVTDLKAHYRGRRYAQEALKFMPPDLAHISIDQLLARFSALGAIHHAT